MSTKLKFIIAFLFSIQIGVVGWSFYEKKQEKEAFRALFSEYLENPAAVKSMDLSGWGIDELIDEMPDFVNLEYLDLSENEFSEIPAVLFELPKLKVLKMSKNKLKKGKWKGSEHLERLDLSHNQLTTIDEIYLFPKLKVLNLSNNELIKFPEVAVLHRFQEFELDSIFIANNRLTDFKEIGEKLSSNRLDYLDLSYNRFGSVKEIGYLKENVLDLNLSGNYLYDFPNQLFDAPSIITKLDLSDCEIDYSGMAINTPNKLKKLDFRRSRPNYNYFLSYFPNVEELYVDELTVSDLSYKNENLKILGVNDIIFEGSENLDLPNLEVLYIDYIFFKTNCQWFNTPKLKKIIFYRYSIEEDNTDFVTTYFPNVKIIEDGLY